jgi:CRP-like cAMP-binding protein
LPIEGECGRLLSTLREMGVPLVRRRYDRGGMIYDGDEAGRALYVLAGGVARLVVSYPGYAGGKRATFLLLGPGDAFGYPLFSRGGPGRVPAGAFTDCEVVKIPKPFLERAMRWRPEVALEVAALLERRLVEYGSWWRASCPAGRRSGWRGRCRCWPGSSAGGPGTAVCP